MFVYVRYQGESLSVGFLLLTQVFEAKRQFQDQLDVHMEQKHNKHTCDVCGKRFPFESELKTHHRKHEDMETARFR